MIDEKKLIEKLYEHVGGDFSIVDIEYLEKIIEEQPKFGEWTPCKRELPKTLGVYQVKRVVYEGYFKNYIVTCAYFDGQNTWHNDNRVNHGRPYLTDVIAWKTLDEPYREDDKS